MKDEIRIVIAEDHPFFRDGLRNALAREEGLRVVAEASDGRAALEYIQTLRPDVAILDISMPEMDGCAVVREIRKEQIPVEVIFLTISDDKETYEAVLEWDVKGYLLKDCDSAEIVRCVRAVLSGRHYTSPAITSLLINDVIGTRNLRKKIPRLNDLTFQERAILKLIARGKTSKEIAQAMDIAPKTVEAHRSNICNKLGIHGNYALARFAAQHRDEI